MHKTLITLAAAAAALLSACSTTQTAPAATPAPATKPPVLQIAQIDRGVQIVLPSVVLFAVGKSELSAPEAGPYLDRVAALLTTKTSKAVSVEGHTDSDGSAGLNDSLSKARAQALADALKARGVAAARISTAGYSFNRPAAANTTEEGKRLNRRVEVVVVDEQVETLTAGEPPGSFEAAWSQLKDLMDRGLVKPAGASS